MSFAALPQHVKLSMLDPAFHHQRVDARSFVQIFPQLGRSLRPVGFPGEREFDQVALCIGGIQRHILHTLSFTFEIGSERAVVLAAAPEAVPALLRKVEGHAGLVHRLHSAQARPEVHMRLTAKLLHELFQSRVLPQSLDESPDRIERRGVHLLF